MAGELYESWVAYRYILEYLERTVKTDEDADDGNDRSLNDLDRGCEGRAKCVIMLILNNMIEKGNLLSVEKVQQLSRTVTRLFTGCDKIDQLSVEHRRRILWYEYTFDSDKITPFFIGCHQIFECVLYVIRSKLDHVENGLRFRLSLGFNQNDEDDAGEGELTRVRDLCGHLGYIRDSWLLLTEMYSMMVTLDRSSYLKYIHRVNTVSGINSPQMMTVTKRTYQLENHLNPTLFTDEKIKRAWRNAETSSDKHIYTICNALLDVHDAVSGAWTSHLVTATTLIGITMGTQGTPNTILADRVVRQLQDSRLLRLLGSCREHISTVGVELVIAKEMCDYPLSCHYLDLFDRESAYFGNHSVGLHFKWHADLVSKYVKRRPSMSEFYTQHLPRLKLEIIKSLGIETSNPRIRVAVGGNVTEFIDRVIHSVNPSRIYISRNEFLASSRKTIFRHLVAGTSIHSFDLPLDTIEGDHEQEEEQEQATKTGTDGVKETDKRTQQSIYDLLKHSDLEEAIEDDSNGNNNGSNNNNNDSNNNVDLVILSMVDSVSQHTFAMDEILNIIQLVRPNTTILIDITQSYFNLPHRWNDIITSYPNVLLVGSMIKHARCGEGLGFLVYNLENNIKPDSGWTSHLSGLVRNDSGHRTVAATNHTPPTRLINPVTHTQDHAQYGDGELVYDSDTKWEGGTNPNMLSVLVATDTLIMMPPLEQQYRYTQTLVELFLAKSNLKPIDDNKRNCQQSGLVLASSNTVTLRTPEHPDTLLSTLKLNNIHGIDYKHIDGCYLLRIGFGINNLRCDVERLSSLMGTSCPPYPSSPVGDSR